MSHVLDVLARHRFSVEVSEGHTVAVINGERVCFRIEEPIQRVVSQKAHVPNPTDRWDYDEVVTHEPAGKLVLVIQSTLWGKYEQRTRWSDGKVQRLENLVGDFVAGLMRTAVAVRRQEGEQKQREAERDRRAREAEQLRKEIEEEEKKLKQLNEWVENWEHAERLRRFIAIYTEKSRTWPAEKQEKYKAWIEWATKQADRLDPFVSEKPASVLDRKHELRSW
jgi:exonuclease VII large subunit